jgi:[ribosomal protein S5]-alanine N-acetyltransferase
MKDDAHLVTERLLLRPLTRHDAPHLYPVYSSRQAMRYMDTPPHQSVAETATKIDDLLIENALWWSICTKDDGIPIGNIGYLGNAGVPGMGYILHPDYWRQGMMSEAIRAALAYGFTKMSLDRVELWINDKNIASQILAQKIGFRQRGQFRMRYAHQPEAHDKLVYGIYRYEWEALPAVVPARPRNAYRLQPVLGVADVQKTAVYYRDKLGFTLDYLYGDPPVHAGVSINEWTTEGVTIQLSRVHDFVKASQGMALYIFTGSDINGRFQTYQSNGVTILREVKSYPWGMREFDVEDCNGYVLRFGTPV